MGPGARFAASGACAPAVRRRVAWAWATLVARHLGRSGLVRFGRIGAWIITLAFAGASVARWASGDTATVSAGVAFEVLAWLAAVAAFGVAVDFERSDEFRELQAFSATATSSGLSAAGVYGGTFRLLAGLLVPQAGVLGFIPVLGARDPGQAWAAVQLWSTWMVAAGLTAALWTALARWAVALHDASPRRTLAVFVVGPLLVAAVFDDVPTLASWFEAASSEIDALQEQIGP